MRPVPALARRPACSRVSALWAGQSRIALRLRGGLVVVALLIAGRVEAQSPSSDRPRFRLDLPTFDAPYNTANGGRAPSMHQSLALTVDFVEASTGLLERAWNGRRWPARLSIAGLYLFSKTVMPLPGDETWMHEEYHRAVLGRRGVDGVDDLYKKFFRFDLRSHLYVSHVADEDLIRLKRDHPADQVRASSAGLEGNYVLVQSLERNDFFRQSSGWQLPVILGTKLASLGYVWSAHLNIVNTRTDQLNQRELHDISVRDFTGHDVTAWVYDLHRPDEPYEARGSLLFQAGINRYIKPSDLTPEELRYVTQQGHLQLINLLDPMLIRPRGFTITNPINDKPMQVSARGDHVLTPFGYSVGADILLQQNGVGLAVGLHTYVNQHRKLPGVDISLVDYPIGKSITASPRLALWSQPADQRFDSLTSRAGGLIGCRLDRYLVHGVGAYVDLEAKSAGWVAGNEYLGANASVRVGMTIRVR